MTAIVDQEGRLFGRVNLIDAAIGLAVLVLLPLAYGAFLLFRPATPTITSVERVLLSNVEERTAGGVSLGGKLKVLGTGLRPNMRASIGDRRAMAFVFETPTSADVIFGADVPPGTYDLVLFDGIQEIARASKAVTVAAGPMRPMARVRLVGAIVGLDEPRASALHVGATFPEGGPVESEIAALDPPQKEVHLLEQPGGAVEVPDPSRWQRPAAVLLSCEANPAGCLLGNRLLGGAAHMVIDVPGSPDLKLRIDEVLPADAPRAASATVRFVGTSEAVDLVKRGDRDQGNPGLTERSASIVAVSSRTVTQGDIVTLAPSPAGSVMAWAAERVAVIDASVRLSVDQGVDGWRYRTRLIKVGAPFVFDSGKYTIRGTVLSLAVDAVETAHGTAR
jgi:hypothetical protein